jgi:hypothetical protein
LFDRARLVEGRFPKWTIMRGTHRLVPMSKSLRCRHVIALAAAYVVALQALLLPLSVAAGSPFHSSLCAAAAATDGLPQPTGHDGGCPCAAGCGRNAACSHSSVRRKLQSY